MAPSGLPNFCFDVHFSVEKGMEKGEGGEKERKKREGEERGKGGKEEGGKKPLLTRGIT